MDDLKLAALMCSKICHELISPVGAFSNGIEVLSEDDDPEMRVHAMALLETSAGQATSKLKFARLAYGSSGGKGSEIDLREAEAAVRELLSGGKIEIHWDTPAAPVNKDVVKVLVNLVTMACDTIPRGGDLSVKIASAGDIEDVSVVATGTRAKLADATRAGIDGDIAIDDLDVRTVIPWVTGRLAREFSSGIHILVEEETIKFSFTFPA